MTTVVLKTAWAFPFAGAENKLLLGATVQLAFHIQKTAMKEL